jgi:uncharacterized protein (DUF58 family)
MSMFFRSLTSTGRSVLAVIPVAFIVGVASGWSEFLVVSVGCLLAIIIGAAWISRPQPLAVSRTLHPPQVTVGESAIGIVQVKNATRRRVGPREAEDTLGDRVVRLSIPALGPGETVETPYTVPAAHRGLFDVGPVRLTRSDPLGLFSREQGQGSIEQLWVRPRVQRVAMVSSGWAKDLDGATSDTAPRGSAAFHALREYQFGDDLRHVHWRTTARRNELMVRHFVDTRRSQEVVMLDPRAELYVGDSFEYAVEIAGSICMAALRDKRSLRLVLPAQSDSAHREEMNVLDRLALVNAVSEASLADAYSQVRPLASSASALIVVTGSADPKELIANSRRVMRSGLVVVIIVKPNATSELLSVGGGRVVSVADTNGFASLWGKAVVRA